VSPDELRCLGELAVWLDRKGMRVNSGQLAALLATRQRYEAALRDAIMAMRFISSCESGTTARLLKEAADDAEASLREARAAAQEGDTE
jgi:hypothetical protein